MPYEIQQTHETSGAGDGKRRQQRAKRTSGYDHGVMCHGESEPALLSSPFQHTTDVHPPMSPDHDVDRSGSEGDFLDLIEQGLQEESESEDSEFARSLEHDLLQCSEQMHYSRDTSKRPMDSQTSASGSGKKSRPDDRNETKELPKLRKVDQSRFGSALNCLYNPRKKLQEGRGTSSYTIEQLDKSLEKFLSMGNDIRNGNQTAYNELQKMLKDFDNSYERSVAERLIHDMTRKD